MHGLSNLNQQGLALLLRRLAPWGFVGLLAVGCLVDDDNKCGEHQVPWDNDLRCVCAEGYTVSADGGCAPMAANAPTGVGKPCASDADCAAFDADYCELAVGKTCRVKNCMRNPSNCFEGFDCCDFSKTPGFESLPTLCLEAGLCPP
jgi:hypothetical protein